MAPTAEKLSFTTTSLLNVVVSNDSDTLFYEIVTPAWEPTLTRISKRDPRTRELELIAELQNTLDGRGSDGDGREGKGKGTPRPFAVRLRGEQFRPASEFFMKEEETGMKRKFRGKDGKHYTWRVRKGKLELVTAGDPEEKPVVRYHKHRRYFGVLRISRQPFIEVQPAALETLDSLIVSFLLMERNRRDGEKLK